MKTIEFKSNYGNFAYRLTAEIGEECTPATEWLCRSQGLGNLGYRVCGSSVDKALGVKTKKDRRFEKRVEVLYDERTAETINAAVSKAITELEKDEKDGAMVKALKLSFAVTGQHEYGSTGTATKEATELWEKVQGLAADVFKTAMAKLGLDVEDYDDDRGIAACAAHIRKEKEEAKKRAAQGLGL